MLGWTNALHLIPAQSQCGNKVSGSITLIAKFLPISNLRKIPELCSGSCSHWGQATSLTRYILVIGIVVKYPSGTVPAMGDAVKEKSSIACLPGAWNPWEIRCFKEDWVFGGAVQATKSVQCVKGRKCFYSNFIMPQKNGNSDYHLT